MPASVFVSSNHAAETRRPPVFAPIGTRTNGNSSAGSVIDLTLSSNLANHERRGVKRSRSKISSSRTYLDAPTSSSTPPTEHPHQAESSRDAMSRIARRFVGDGLDMRRPARLQPDIVDLTGSDDEEDNERERASPASVTGVRHRDLSVSRTGSHAVVRPARRQPRFDRNIINVLDSPPSQRRTPQEPRSEATEDNDFEILDDDLQPERAEQDQRPRANLLWRELPPLPRNPPRPPEALALLRHPVDRFRSEMPEIIDITDDADGPGSRDRPGATPRPIAPSRGTMLLSRLRNYRLPQLNLPSRLDFISTAFNLVIDEPQPPAPPPAYAALEPVQDGFTRSPTEGDELVCPACGDELCVQGVEDDKDKKGEIWVVKACGHVYCGHCATGRPRRAPPKGKGKATKKPQVEGFTVCRVDGCTSKVTSKQAMIQLFL